MTAMALLLFAATLTIAQSTIQTIGYDEVNVTDEGSDPSPYPLARNVFLLSDAAASPGVLFAFSVYFRSTDSVILQVYRPIVAAAKSYRLIAQFNVIPSVMKGREDIYIESLLTRHCIALLPGDRLGVYVPSDPPPLQLKFNPSSKALLYKVSQSPLLGGTIDSSTEYPLSLRAKAYFVTNDSLSALVLNSSSVEVDCVYGLAIPGAFTGASVSTTTIPPITGAMGATGAMGLVGFTGNTGERGLPGAVGAEGSTGSTGVLGATGPDGPTGATGPTGAKGPPGELGATGSTGYSEPGDPGIPGPQGPMGEMGRNRTVSLNRPLPSNQGKKDDDDAFWSSSKAIWVTYIWLAIVSLLLVIVIVVVIVIICVHVSVSRSVRSSPKSTHSRANILEETPSTYSDRDMAMR